MPVACGRRRDGVHWVRNHSDPALVPRLANPQASPTVSARAARPAPSGASAAADTDVTDITDAGGPVKISDESASESGVDARALRAMPVAVVATDADFRVSLMNPAAEALYGVSEQDALGRNVSDVVSTDHGSPERERAAWSALLDGSAWSGRVRQRGTGDWREVWLVSSVMRTSDGAPSGALMVAHGIAALQVAEQDAADRSTFASAVLESLPGRTCVVDRAGMVIAANQRYRIEGPAGAGESTGPDTGQSYVAWAAETIDDDAAFALRELLEGERPDFCTEFVTVRRRRRRWTELDAVPLGMESGGAVITHVDITTRKQAETTLTRRATHDALTGLPNRVLLADRLSHALARSARTGGSVGVLFCDLDGFREVNNKFGHLAGDRLLVTVAKRLRAVCRSSDTVARVSGDEFVVVLEDVTGPAEVEEVARRVLDALTEPVVLEEGTARTGTSIGLVISHGSPRAGMRAVEGLIRDADAAMYAAKEAGRARFAWFTPEMRERPRERPTFARAIGRLFRS